MKASKRRLKGERLAILRDESSDSYDKDGLIARPESYKNAPLSGRIVAIGNRVSPDEGFYLGQEVNFNKYNVNGFALALEGYEEPFEMDVLHVLDIYWDVEK